MALPFFDAIMTEGGEAAASPANTGGDLPSFTDFWEDSGSPVRAEGQSWRDADKFSTPNSGRSSSGASSFSSGMKISYTKGIHSLTGTPKVLTDDPFFAGKCSEYEGYKSSSCELVRTHVYDVAVRSAHLYGHCMLASVVLFTDALHADGKSFAVNSIRFIFAKQDGTWAILSTRHLNQVVKGVADTSRLSR